MASSAVPQLSKIVNIALDRPERTDPKQFSFGVCNTLQDPNDRRRIALATPMISIICLQLSLFAATYT
jgi:DNA gyrase inhibitor GyrI